MPRTTTPTSGPRVSTTFPAGVTGPSNDFYSFDIPVTGGTWHVISLDSECAALPATWAGPRLRAPPVVHRGHPRRRSYATTSLPTRGIARSSIGISPPSRRTSGNDTDYQAFWDDAVQYHVTAIVNGHAHDYERLDPMDANGNLRLHRGDRVRGRHRREQPRHGRLPQPNVVKDDFGNFGVLQLTLNATSANFAFDRSVVAPRTAARSTASSPPDRASPR